MLARRCGAVAEIPGWGLRTVEIQFLAQLPVPLELVRKILQHRLDVTPPSEHPIFRVWVKKVWEFSENMFKVSIDPRGSFVFKNRIKFSRDGPVKAYFCLLSDPSVTLHGVFGMNILFTGDPDQAHLMQLRTKQALAPFRDDEIAIDYRLGMYALQFHLLWTPFS
jgi:hypothetical protein